MSAVMLAGQYLGWMKEQPPEVLSEETLERADMLEGRSFEVVPGVRGGEPLRFRRRRGRSLSPAAKGDAEASGGAYRDAFGLGIWGASYRGWIPAMNILPPEQYPGRRGTLMMIAAHVVYGTTDGALSHRASQRQRRSIGLPT
jgi:hypothetical protein